MSQLHQIPPAPEPTRASAGLASLDSRPAQMRGSLDVAELASMAARCPRDRIVRLFHTLTAEDPQSIVKIFSLYHEQRDPDRKDLYFRALRTLLVNRPELTAELTPQSFSSPGFRTSLNILNVPLGPRQGGGLLVDFHLVSQLCLQPLGTVRFLPVPSRFPAPAALSPRGRSTFDMERAAIFEDELYIEQPFGRSYRYLRRDKAADALDATPIAVLKGPRKNTDTSALRYEAEVMDYLNRFREYFGLESSLPYPFRGPGNRTQAWEFNGTPYLHYAAHPTYFRYVESAKDHDEVLAMSTLNVRDLMRLARFGIFHTELAPIYHSIEQGRRYVWNVGGLLPGAGSLKEWKESFSFANQRVSGIADFEHVVRFAALPSTASIVNDTEDLASLGLQYHLGNIVFCSLHLLALGCQNTPLKGQVPTHSVEALFKDAFQSFTGSEWEDFERDIDVTLVAAELGGLSEAPDHIGEYAGAYPFQNVIKAVTAFTLRAIPQFVAQRVILRSALPAPTPQPPKPPQGAIISTLPSNLHALMARVKHSRIVSSLVDAGLGAECVDAFIGQLLLGDVAEVRGETLAEPLIAIRFEGVRKALTRLLSHAQTHSILNGVPFAPESNPMTSGVESRDLWIY